MKFFESYKEKGQIKYKLFGITIFRLGKRASPYDMDEILSNITGIQFHTRKVRLQHGWYTSGEPWSADLSKKSVKVMLAWNTRICEAWNKSSNAPSYPIGAPFALYRKHAGITQQPDAKGTIVYPSHSLKCSKALYNIDVYCEQLKALPAEFHPICINLHPTDVRIHGMDKEYEKRGFKTICAGSDTSRPFYEIFYENLRQYKYASSNEPGSYLLYAVEMGIPFFILGDQAILENGYKKDDDIYSKQGRELFENHAKDKISAEQRAFVLAELGLDDCISLEQLSDILKKHPR